jgi:hypothetical protein
MPRIRRSGSSLMTPSRPESELKRILSDLTHGHQFDDHSVHQYYLTLSSIIGGWLSEQGQLESGSVKKILLTIARSLDDASGYLAGLETGIRTDVELTISSRVLNLMAQDPTIGSTESAQQLLSSFRRDAERISHVCDVAAAELPSRPDKRGRKAKGWYDSFMVLLLEVADKANIKPTLHRDRDNGDALTGWVLEAAGRLETFLPKEMRSPSDEARYKRLERSKGHLRLG